MAIASSKEITEPTKDRITPIVQNETIDLLENLNENLNEQVDELFKSDENIEEIQDENAVELSICAHLINQKNEEDLTEIFTANKVVKKNISKILLSF